MHMQACSFMLSNKYNFLKNVLFLCIMNKSKIAALHAHLSDICTVYMRNGNNMKSNIKRWKVQEIPSLTVSDMKDISYIFFQKTIYDKEKENKMFISVIWKEFKNNIKTKTLKK
ncbi:hypothetical protein KUTeg_004100 [Tegillarca granosa]|uniref:Uncharacterized protein n=1 Tax=Tegillarca granosa TaxID=220873 RepID=A0ABQ9FNY6_TEGGR|nr:hypothetical protein KUTeg_004100 [Tegillarca granosa]